MRGSRAGRPEPVAAQLPFGNNTGKCRIGEDGFSLVELLIAMVLGLLLIGGAITLFSGTKRSSDFNEEVASMQGSSRFLINAIASDIRMAGHQGCLDGNGQVVSIIADDPPSTDLRRTAISGSVIQSDGRWLPALALGTGSGAFSPPTINAAVPGTHAIAVQFGGPETRELLGPLLSSGKEDAAGLIPVDGDIGIDVGELAMISTCEGGELFRVTSVSHDSDGNASLGHSEALNTEGDFQEIYGVVAVSAQTRIMPFRTHVYYVGETGRKNSDGVPRRALYQHAMPFNDDSNPPVKLADGVDDLKVSFGVGDDDGRLRYVDAADAMFDARRVRSVRIGLLISSWNQLSHQNDARTYQLAGHTIKPVTGIAGLDEYVSDRRFRQAFNTTAKVRNRRAGL